MKIPIMELIERHVEAIRNIIKSYRFQWTLEGDPCARFGYLTRYWAAYLYYRRLAGDLINHEEVRR